MSCPEVSRHDLVCIVALTPVAHAVGRIHRVVAAMDIGVAVHARQTLCFANGRTGVPVIDGCGVADGGAGSILGHVAIASNAWNVA